MAEAAKNRACPVCGAAVGPRADNRVFPFCSERCRTIDLGRWLDERYRLPASEPPSDDGGIDDDNT